MSVRRAALIAAVLCLSAVASVPAPAMAAGSPAWVLALTPMPANFSVAASHEPEYMLSATNVGATPSAGQVLLNATLPAGLTPDATESENSDPGAATDPSCKITPPQVSCETGEAVGPGQRLLVQITVAVSAPDGTYDTEASVSGGGAAQEVKTTFPTQVQDNPLPFGFLPGFQAPITEEDGAPTLLAGSHPYQQTVAFGFPTRNPGDKVTNAGHPRDVYTELPRGMAGDPAASPLLCTEAELTVGGCPDESQVGLLDVTTLVGQQGTNAIATSNLYNMVPPPGVAAELGTNVSSVGIFAHILIGVRSDGDYGVEAVTRDVLAFGQQPIFAAQAQIWGDPSSPAHDQIRGACGDAGGSCPVEPQEIALLTTPSDCPGTPLPFEIHADSWEEPSPDFAEPRTLYKSADLTGSPVSLTGCGELAFKPEISSLPTTNLTDSPSGLDFALHQPTDMKLSNRSPAELKDATIRFPAGLAVNPSQAAGLDACSEAQVGFSGREGARLLFSKQPQSCPDAAKIGSLEVTSPALVRRNEAHEVELDEGEPVLEPLHGSLYVARPFANPFGSLIAVYLVIEDEKTGIVAKLAAEGELDPTTGQVTTTVRENPEFPLEDVRVHLFGGARGAFTTPPTCGKFTTESDLTPWSAPDGKDAKPTGSFQAPAAPAGGPCPSTEAQLPHTPTFVAGTLSPQAGAFSPLHLKLSRTDGTQRWQTLEATLPAGLSAKLAGVGQCSPAAIAQARSREAPNQGALEQADPSCPASSKIGSIVASAGSGPTPFYTSGALYLAGPYKGAPLSAVAIAPAVAGPFDLGTVVVQSAIYLDPITARGRVVSDPFPALLHGVPVDLRSAAINADRPGFTLNPTSCNESAFAGVLISTLGQPAPLAQRFQVGGCASLPYKPTFSARLFGKTNRGAHPRFRAVITAKPGEANTAALSFTLPRSEFIDQGHFRTICTRVQFAANQCPAGSVYGFVKAKSPLVDYTLEGPIYLRSSSHKLPDAVAVLRGPPSQPIEIDSVARIDSVKGRLRSRVETVPDAPLEEVVVSLQGGPKGLFQNSTNICKGTHRIGVSFVGQNGKAHDLQPSLKAQCGGAKSKHKGRKH